MVIITEPESVNCGAFDELVIESGAGGKYARYLVVAESGEVTIATTVSSVKFGTKGVSILEGNLRVSNGPKVELNFEQDGEVVEITFNDE